MKKSLVFPLAIAMLVPVACFAQEAQTSSAPPATRSSKSPRVEKPRTITGVVSADAKTFLDGKQAKWSVVNSDALSGFANQRVKVKYLLASGQHQIQILSVKLAEPLLQNTAYKTDSAFRR